MSALDPNVQAAMVTAGGTVLVAFVGIIAELVRRLGKRLGEVKEHVANKHETNLRDDIDRVLSGLGRVIDTQRQHGKEIAGIREEIRTERRERMQVEERLDRLAVDVSR